MREILLGIILFVCGFAVYGQNYHRITINASVNSCTSGNNPPPIPSFDIIFDEQVIYVTGKTGEIYDNTNYGSNPGSGIFSILVEGSFCIGSVTQAYNFTGKTCHTQNFSGSIGGGATITGFIKYQAPSLSIPTITGATPDSPNEVLCGDVSLTTAGSAGSYRWQVAQSTTSIFRTFATTSSNHVFINKSTFESYGFTNPKLFFKVTDASCSERVSVVSGGYAFGDPPPDEASIVPDHVTCKGDSDGTITISDIQFTRGPGTFENYDGSKSLTYTIEKSDGSRTLPNFESSLTTVRVDNVPIGTWVVDVEFTSSSGPIGPGPIGPIEPHCTAVRLGSVTISEPSAQLDIGTPVPTDVTCHGENDGSITMNSDKGWGGYTYSKNSSAAAAYTSNTVFSGLVAGAYIMRVKDSGGCVKVTSVTVGEPNAPLNFSVSKTNEECHSANDGTITITPTGGWGAESGFNNTYYFSIKRGSGSWSVWTPTTSGSKVYTGLFGTSTYSVRVKDKETKGCTVTKNDVITIDRPPSGLSIGTPSKTNETCRSANDGTVTINASGGWGGYKYSINSTTVDGNSNTFIGLSAGTYTLRVKDSGNCVKSTSVTISQPGSELTISATNKETCKGTSDGSITVLRSGGWGTYTYSINSAAAADYVSSNTFSGLAQGTYVMRVRDNGGCVKSTSVTINEPAAIVSFSSISNTDVTCKNTSTGTITVAGAAGGWGGYQYSKDNGATYQSSNVIENLSTGNYTVLVKDSEGCTSSSQPITIDEPSATLSFTNNRSQITCQGDENGAITFTATGGWGSTMYSIDNGVSYHSSNSFSGLSAGAYQLRIKDSGNCETVKQDVLISEPNDFLDIEVEYTDVVCKNAADGTITLSGVGGWAGYTYSIDNGVTYHASGSFVNLTPASYQVMVKDLEECQTASQTVTISEPNEILSFTSEAFDVSCKNEGDGIIIFTASDGWGDYEYSIDGGISYQLNNSFTMLVPDNYDLRVKDLKGCETAVQLVTITEPALLTATTSIQHVQCFGDNNGQITVNTSGGTMNYSYSIDGGVTFQPSNVFRDLLADSYSIIVKDANDCPLNVDAIVATPSPIAGNIVTTNPVSCNGDSDGQIAVAVGGGTGDLSYLWSTGATSVAISDLSAGDYSLLVTDDNGCTNTFDYTLIEPDVLEITSVAISHVSCFGGSDVSIDVTIQGGTLSYGFSWDNGETTEDLDNISIGTYMLTITDARGCTTTESYTITEPPLLIVSVDQVNNVSCFSGNDGIITLSAIGGASALYEYSLDGTNWQSSNIISGLIADTYTLYVEDENGCISTTTAVVTEPTLLEVSTMNIVNTTCGFPVGSAESLVTGGTAPYSYSWTDAFSNEISTDEDISEVLSGIYTVEVTDAKGCMQSALAVISNTDGADYTITAVEPTLCHDSADGQATVMINHIVTPYTVLWSSGETTLTATGLVAGINVVTLTDGNNCDAIQTVMVGAPDALGVSTISEQYPSCNGEMDAITVVEGVGGTAPYAYTWDNGQTGNTLSNVGAGDYQVTIVDDHACEEVFTITVQETPILEIIVVESRIPTCTSGSDAILEVEGQGGTGPYTYDWGVLGTTVRIEGLSSGDYPITVMDANGCTTSSTLTLLDPPLLDFTVVSESSPTCNGVMNGFVEITGVNGRAPYTYQWLTGATGNRLSNIAGGNYEVEITDANGCMNTLTVPFAEPEVLEVGVVTQIDPSCHGFNNGQIEVLATGGTEPYFYNWSTGITGELLGDVIAGTYQVDVLDVNGCSTSVTVTLSEPDPLAISVVDFVLPTCYNTDDGIIEIEISGGTAPYTTSWAIGSSDNRITSLIQGEYEVTITDDQGCVLIETISLTGVESIEAAITVTDPLCYGYADGAITLTTMGGTGTLSYLWNDGVTDVNRTNLSSGTYSVVITDENGCTREENITLTDPTEIVFDLPDAEICVGGNHRASIDLGDHYTYTWTLDNGFTTTGGVVNLDQVGTYTVVATDEKGCFGTDTFTIATNENLLQADFLMTTESYVGDTVVIIDISWPLPETVLWGFDEGATKVLNSSNDYLELVFTESGTYQITQDVGLAECADYLAQEISILRAVDKPDGEGGRVSSDTESLITSLQVYPNPTDGQFSVEVDLSRLASISVSLISATNNTQIFKEQKSGNDHYTLDYSLSSRLLQPGIYFIVAQTEGEMETIRLMVR